MKSYASIVRSLTVLLLFMLFDARAQAQLTIEITKGVEGAIPIAIVPFAAPSLPAEEDVAGIVTDDLQRSGRFDTLPPQSQPERPSAFAEVNFPAWRGARVDYVVVGQVSAGASGYAVRFDLADAIQGKQILGLSFNVGERELRRLAHHISDLIYEKLTGERGAFGTRIAYVTAVRRGPAFSYTLSVADADGYNPHVILRSSQPLLSPAWSPDGNRLAYVSFENRRAQIFVQDVYTGARRAVSSEPGINSAPAWSPDGGRLAFVLSKDGNPEIYTASAGGGGVQRLTNNTAIDTEPTWSPDGRSIVFTSDRGGAPQLYRLDLASGQAQRLTFEGDYNARPVFSGDGRYLAMVHRRNGRFYIAAMEMASRQLRVLTEGGLEESPSFSPDNRMILYATTEGGRETLAAVSVDGKIKQRLALRGGNVREPAWSPNSP
ncbi:MAG: Tol-Pal system beta propeller repeat protein TolB [Gammaproteobacteria bacterium]